MNLNHDSPIKKAIDFNESFDDGNDQMSQLSGRVRVSVYSL